MKRFLIPAALLAAISLAATPAAASCGHSDPSVYTSGVPLTEKLLNSLRGISLDQVRLKMGVAGCKVFDMNDLRFDMKTPSGAEGQVFVHYSNEKIESIDANIFVPGGDAHLEWQWSPDGELNCSDFSGSEKRCQEQ